MHQPTHFTVFVNGYILGVTTEPRILLESIRELRRSGILNPFVRWRDPKRLKIYENIPLAYQRITTSERCSSPPTADASVVHIWSSTEILATYWPTRWPSICSRVRLVLFLLWMEFQVKFKFLKNIFRSSHSPTSSTGATLNSLMSTKRIIPI